MSLEAGVGGMHQLASSKPGSSWQNPPTPKLSSSWLRLINLPSFPYLFLEVSVFCLFFLNRLVMGGSPFWRVIRKTPKMPARPQKLPVASPSNSARSSWRLIAEEGVREACKLECVPQGGISV